MNTYLLGESTLIDSCLSSIPMYIMGVYQLYEGNFQRLDIIKSRFFWQGTSKKRKYHMINGKLIDILERGDNSLCCELLRKKYLGHKSIFQIKNRRGSQLWRSSLDVREWYQRGRVINIRAGLQTRFWHDCWLGNCPLKVSFPNLFEITSQPDIDVAHAIVDGQWNIDFRRQLNANLLEEWERLGDY